MNRTTWAEEQVAKLCASPLTAETVFLRVKYREKAGIEKEVCDLIFALAGEGIIVSMKAQDDPLSRDAEKLARWCAKASRKAARALGGALRTMRSTSFWCQHCRRGRVGFGAGAIRVRHAIAIVETLTAPGTLQNDLPDGADGIPFTYLSINDFLNLVVELRAFPDLLAYLDARLKLPETIRRGIGQERLLYKYFLLSGESFDGFGNLETMRAAVESRASELGRLLAAKRAADVYASVVEQVSDALATRAADYAIGLDTETLAKFDGDARRKNYLLLQENLCDLGLAARRRLGEALSILARKVAANTERTDMAFAAFFTDAKPDFLYVPMAAKGLGRPEILKRAQAAVLGGLAHYQKLRGMAIVNRDKRVYEVVLAQVECHTSEAITFGAHMFGELKITDSPASLLPSTGS